MKAIHTQKKSANRPFFGVQPTYGYNLANQFRNGKPMNYTPGRKIPRPAYKRAVALS